MYFPINLQFTDLENWACLVEHEAHALAGIEEKHTHTKVFFNTNFFIAICCPVWKSVELFCLRFLN